MALGTSQLLQTSKASLSRPKDIVNSASSSSTGLYLASLFNFFYFNIYFSPTSDQLFGHGRASAGRGSHTARRRPPRRGGTGLCAMSSSDLSPRNASTNHLDPICDAGSPGPPAFPSQLPPPASLRPTAAFAQGPAVSRQSPCPTGACTPLSEARGDWGG